MENTEKKFEACPVCGSKERFFETLAKQLKELGYAREDWGFYFNSISGVVLDKAKEASIPMGAEVPGFEVYTDICLDCGTIYAVRLVSGEAKKAVIPPKITLPGQDIPPFGLAGGDLKRN